MALLYPDVDTPVDVHDGLDRCDECGKTMPLTGDSLCEGCTEDERRRCTCIACGSRLLFLDEQTCSDRCRDRVDEWPEA